MRLFGGKERMLKIWMMFVDVGWVGWWGWWRWSKVERVGEREKSESAVPESNPFVGELVAEKGLAGWRYGRGEGGGRVGLDGERWGWVLGKVWLVDRIGLVTQQ